jgi:hypothetical protein
MPKSIQFKKLLLLMLLFSSSTNVFSQTIEDYIDNQWQDSRYINHKDGTVTDNKTTLMWKRCPEGLSGSSCTTGTAATKYNYKFAIERADASENQPFATYSDWRLPNKKELSSLVARDRYDPAINSTLFPNTPNTPNTPYTPGGGFWSSSPMPIIYDPYDGFTWVINFDHGYESKARRRTGHYVRLVRGGQ